MLDNIQKMAICSFSGIPLPKGAGGFGGIIDWLTVN